MGLPRLAGLDTTPQHPSDSQGAQPRGSLNSPPLFLQLGNKLFKKKNNVFSPSFPAGNVSFSMAESIAVVGVNLVIAQRKRDELGSISGLCGPSSSLKDNGDVG